MTHGSLFVAPVPGAPPVGMSATDARLAMGGIYGVVAGVVSGGGISASGVNMGFTVPQAVFSIPDVTNAAGVFFSPTDLTVVTPAVGPGSGSRKDLICVRARNYENGDADSQASVLLVAGTAGSPGVDPGVPSGYYKYATVTIPTSATLATSCTVQIFGNTKFAPPDVQATTLANLNTMTGATAQQAVVTADGANNGIYLWTGSAWSSARPKGSRVQLGDAYAAVASATTLGTAMTDVTGATVTATSAGGKVRVTAILTAENSGSGANRTANFQLLCDGVLIGEVSRVFTLMLVAGTYMQLSVTHTAFSTPAAGSHTWKLQGSASVAAAVQVFETTLMVEEYV